MLFRSETLQSIAAGAVTVAFRRWRRPTVRTGGTLRTAVGVLSIDAVEPISADAITDEDARRAGFPGRQALLEDIESQRQGQLYRIRFRLSGEDPRIRLRESDGLSADDIRAIGARLARMDGADPWTGRVLRLIESYPDRRAGDLCVEAGMEKEVFKTRVRKLKNQGLTESREVGYRISPRGRAYLRLSERVKESDPDATSSGHAAKR